MEGLLSMRYIIVLGLFLGELFEGPVYVLVLLKVKTFLWHNFLVNLPVDFNQVRHLHNANSFNNLDLWLILQWMWDNLGGGDFPLITVKLKIFIEQHGLGLNWVIGIMFGEAFVIGLVLADLAEFVRWRLISLSGLSVCLILFFKSKSALLNVGDRTWWEFEFLV